uniref:Small ribosomal subunit protein uS12 n=1 Tax=Meleagris gallopavo TaxID=9103 RepID=A0A803YS61_MELGA
MALISHGEGRSQHPSGWSKRNGPSAPREHFAEHKGIMHTGVLPPPLRSGKMAAPARGPASSQRPLGDGRSPAPRKEPARLYVPVADRHLSLGALPSNCLNASKTIVCFRKCRGLRTARKLRSHRRDQKWHDKQYKKAHLGTALKANPFGGASHAKGIVLEKVGVEAKQPNSAIRKCVRINIFLRNRARVYQVKSVQLLSALKSCLLICDLIQMDLLSTPQSLLHRKCKALYSDLPGQKPFNSFSNRILCIF